MVLPTGWFMSLFLILNKYLSKNWQITWVNTCSKLKIKVSQQYPWMLFIDFIVDFEQVLNHWAQKIEILFLTYSFPFPCPNNLKDHSNYWLTQYKDLFVVAVAANVTYQFHNSTTLDLKYTGPKWKNQALIKNRHNV